MELYIPYTEGNLELLKEIVSEIDFKTVANILGIIHYSNNFECTEFLVSKCIEANVDFNWGRVLGNACHCANRKTVDFIISKSIEKDIKLDYVGGFYDTCNGDSKLVNWSVRYGIGDKTSDRIEIIKLMISKGIENGNYFKWDELLYLVNKCGYLEIVEIIFNRAIECKYFSWNLALRFACKGGNIHIVNLIMDKAINVINKQGVLSAAIFGKNNEIIDLMLKYGVTGDDQLPQEYIEYKQTQALKYTKLHESLISMII